MKPQVVVVGSFVQDLMWKCTAFPGAGETIIGSFVTGPGGKGSNQAVASGRAGARTAFIGAVGDDVFAEGAARFHRAEGIDAHFVRKGGQPTGTAAILVNDAGQNEIVVALGASALLRPGDVDAALIRGAKIVVCQHEANLPVNAHVFRVARKAGVMTVLNPAPMRPDFDPAILRLTDVLIPNESEFVGLVRRVPRCAALVRGKDFRRRGPFCEETLSDLPFDSLHRLCRVLGVPTVIVTLGKRGCFLSQADGVHVAIKGHRGIKVIDTTGAGDAFVGGFAAGFVKSGGNAEAAARLGNAVAALSVTKLGTAPSMPSARDIARFLGSRGRPR